MSSDPKGPEGFESKQAALMHIERPPLPWRTVVSTECGRPISELANGLVVTVSAAQKWFKDNGARRASLFFCVTCCDTTNRWKSWQQDPVDRMYRELQHMGWGGRRDKNRALVGAELRAIEALVSQHREEFEEIKAAHLRGDIKALPVRTNHGGGNLD